MLSALSGLQHPATGGLRRLLVAPFAAYAYTYTDASCRTLASTTATGWVALECADGCTFGEAWQRTLGGRKVPQALGLAAPGLSPDVQAAHDNLYRQGPVLALCEDYRLQWWLLGQDFGLRVPTASAKGGTFRAETGHAVELSGAQRTPMRAVSPAVIDLILGTDSPEPEVPVLGFPYAFPIAF